MIIVMFGRRSESFEATDHHANCKVLMVAASAVRKTGAPLPGGLKTTKRKQ